MKTDFDRVTDEAATLSYARPGLNRYRDVGFKAVASVGVFLGLISAAAYGEPLWWAWLIGLLPQDVTRFTRQPISVELWVTIHTICCVKGVVLALTSVLLGSRKRVAPSVAIVYLVLEVLSQFARLRMEFGDIGMWFRGTRQTAIVALQALTDASMPIALIAVMLLLTSHANERDVSSSPRAPADETRGGA